MTEKLTNVTAEQMLLGAIILGKPHIDRVMSFLLPEHFIEPLHADIFTALIRETEAGREISPVLIKDEFDSHPALKELGGYDYLKRLAGLAGVVMNPVDYAKTIYDLARKRQMLEMITDVTNKIQTYPELSSDELAAGLSGELDKLASNEASNRIKTSKQVTLEIYEDMQKNSPCFSTGIKVLDDAMEGGLYLKKSYGIAARLKNGKTMLAGTISYNLNHAGVPHLFVCAEMGRREIHQRNVARAVNRNALAFVKGERDSVDFQADVVGAARKDPGNIYYLEASGIYFSDLKRSIANAIMRYKIKGVIIDYWQLVRGKRKDQSQTEHLDEVAQWVADFCRQENIFSLTMAQINREGNTRGGDGINLAFDQTYHLQKVDESPFVFLEMLSTRYTLWSDIGSKAHPEIILDNIGPHFRDRFTG